MSSTDLYIQNLNRRVEQLSFEVHELKEELEKTNSLLLRLLEEDR